jgi:FixJ family two-component response regulator
MKEAPKSTAPTIYIVDDDDSMRRAITLLLRTVGYNPIAFTRPGEFLGKFDPNVHGCLVLDIRMPEMSGLEVQQRRRSESLTPREKEVFVLIVDGKANKVVAIDLGLSERTVEIHRGNVMEKMGARSVAHLVKMYLTLHPDRAAT